MRGEVRDVEHRARDHTVPHARQQHAGIVALDVDNITTALYIAAQGLAATLTPAYVGIIARPLGLAMRRVTAPEAIRHVCLYRPALRSIPPAAEAFAEFLADWVRRWNAALPAMPQRSRRAARPRKR
jgi:DNA-binding transcriptional LysR family regulator